MLFLIVNSLVLYKRAIMYWVIFNFVVAWIIKKVTQKSWEKKSASITSKEGEKIMIDNIHDYYYEFSKKRPQIGLFYLGLSLSTIGWIKLILYWMLCFTVFLIFK